MEECNFTTSTALVIPGVSPDEIRLSVNRALEGIEDLRQERYVGARNIRLRRISA